MIAFVRAAQMELVWVSEREEHEVTRNWSDIKQLDLPMLTNYYKQVKICWRIWGAENVGAPPVHKIAKFY